MTLKEIWEGKGMTPTEVAAAAGISVPTLYRMNKKEPGVHRNNIAAVCQVLGITRQQYDRLESGN